MIHLQLFLIIKKCMIIFLITLRKKKRVEFGVSKSECMTQIRVVKIHKKPVLDLSRAV